MALNPRRRRNRPATISQKRRSRPAPGPDMPAPADEWTLPASMPKPVPHEPEPVEVEPPRPEVQPQAAPLAPERDSRLDGTSPLQRARLRPALEHLSGVKSCQCPRCWEGRGSVRKRRARIVGPQRAGESARSWQRPEDRDPTRIPFDPDDLMNTEF